MGEIAGHYGDRLVKAFETHASQNGGGPRILRYAFPSGESSKNRETKSAIEAGFEIVPICKS